MLFESLLIYQVMLLSVFNIYIFFEGIFSVKIQISGAINIMC